VPAESRAVADAVIGIVETAVLQSDAMFKRSDGSSVWEELND
jgi:hypothetical protein